MSPDESPFAPFAGIASFLKSPLIAQPTRAHGEVAVLGVPFDQGATARSGARFGPRAIRDASTMYAYFPPGERVLDGETGDWILDGVRFVDAGDVDIPPMAPVELYHQRVAGRMRELVAAGLFVVGLGGDHSVTYPLLKGLREARGGKPVHLVQLDTHMDYWSDEGGQLYTHASPVIRAHEDGLISTATQYGVRGLHTIRDNIEVAQGRGVHIFWCEQAKRTPVEELIAHIEPGEDVYITLDIDALDPCIAPGTGTPEPGGFSYYEAKAIMRAVAQRANLVGMDVVEVSPPYDVSQLTAQHAARLILDTVGAAFGGENDPRRRRRP
jgi:agmatinase